ncbi:hypothetical protein, partial [Mannheimia haemolytica]|uniref:hypothetical protein n=1 Tax=Mannheimia haemolytica TaxID=75985 RepID=UPI001EE31C85
RKNSLFEQRSGEFGIFSLSKFKPSEDSGEVGSPFFGYFLWRSKESDIKTDISLPFPDPKNVTSLCQ